MLTIPIADTVINVYEFIIAFLEEFLTTIQPNMGLHKP